MMQGVVTGHNLRGTFPVRAVADLMTEGSENLLMESEQAISAVNGSASMHAGFHGSGVTAVLRSNPITGVLTGNEQITGRLEYGH